MSITRKRRELQRAFNKKMGIIPKTIGREVRDYGRGLGEMAELTIESVPEDEIPILIQDLEREMRKAAESLEFEKAAMIRDKIKELKVATA